MLSKRQDQYGFYKVGPMKFYSKLEAIEVQQRTNFPFSWHFNDEVYDRYDWEKEPKESISELYRRRAQQLRDEYEYLVLWYSGGADSDNILNVFLDNDIKIDEVVSMINYEGSKDKLHPFNAEIFHVAIPKIEEAKKRQPGIHHRVIDMTQYVIDQYSVLDLDWIYKQNFMFTPVHHTKSMIKNKIPEWADMFESGKKVGFISGIEKPRIIISPDKEYYFRFNDCAIDVCVSPGMQLANNPWEFDEFFYWSPACPELVIKQCHIIKHFIKNNQEKMIKRAVVTAPPTAACIVQQLHEDGQMSYFTNDELNVLIYPSWYNIPFQFKASSVIYYDKDDWFIKTNETASSNWHTGLDQILKVTMTDPNKKRYVGSICFGKKYSLGK